MPSKVYVGNLPDNCNPDNLRDLFGSYGEITELDVIKNFAFVHFLNESDAKSAVRDLDKSKMLGQQITVQLSKHQQNRDRREDRTSNPRRNSSGRGNMGPPMIPPLGGLGGILGAGPGANPLGGLGILSAVNTLAAAAEHQQRLNEPDSEVRVRREVMHTRDVPTAAKQGLSNGYVIYERYYVDPSHPLLKGLPLPELPRMTDTLASSDSYRREPYDRVDAYGSFRERSPLTDRKDYQSLPYENNYDNRYFDRL